MGGFANVGGPEAVEEMRTWFVSQVWNRWSKDAGLTAAAVPEAVLMHHDCGRHQILDLHTGAFLTGGFTNKSKA